MKKIAIIGLVLVPLMTGCSNSTLGPRLAPEAKQAHSASSLQAQLSKLRQRVRALNRRVKAQASRSPYASGAGPGGLRDVKARLARLEAAPRPDEAATPGPDVEQTIAELAAQVAALSRKVEAQAVRQPQPSPATTRDLTELKARLAELETGPRPAETAASHSDLKRTVVGLAARLEEVSRKIEAESNRPAQVPLLVTQNLGDLKTRLGELEAAQRAATSRADQSDVKRTLTTLTARLQDLSRNVQAQANRPPQAPPAISRDIKELKTKLGQLESATNSAASGTSVTNLKQTVARLTAQVEELASQAGKRASNPAPRDDAAMRKVTESLTRLERVQAKSTNELGQLQTDLEKDRALVIDYLEDLDNRLATLEKVAPAAKPAAPSPTPAPPASPAPSKP